MDLKASEINTQEGNHVDTAEPSLGSPAPVRTLDTTSGHVSAHVFSQNGKPTQVRGTAAKPAVSPLFTMTGGEKRN